MQRKKGYLVISLDFEMYWGMADLMDLSDADRFEKVREVVPRLLDLFRKYKIHATWATVGAMMSKDYDDFKKHLPKRVSDQLANSISKIEHSCDNGKCCAPEVLFCPDLISTIVSEEGQEIGSHTFSHYYCNWKSSNPDDFRSEMEAACRIADANGIELKSFVFPRNRMSTPYIRVLSDLGFRAYRGNGSSSWITSLSKLSWNIYRFFDRFDNYLPLESQMPFSLETMQYGNHILNVQSSRFFKPYSKKYRYLEPLKNIRFKLELLHAAKKGKIYHIYWHPHNYTDHMDKNFEMLENFLSFYARLRKKYGIESLSIGEVVDEFQRKKSK